MRTIALEEHFATPAFLDGPACGLKERAEKVGGRFAAVDRIMFSTDHPYQSMAEGRAFLDRRAGQRQ